MKIRRILLKLSGEVLSGQNGFGIENDSLKYFSGQIKEVVDKGLQLGIVIGGGNIFRGAELIENGFLDQVQGDYMGMLATVINGLALQTSLEHSGLKCKLITSFEIGKIGEPYNQHKVLNYFEQNYVVIFSGGTGNPLFTTDSAAALRAIEIHADVLLKGTKVDGVYSSDPVKNPKANRFTSVSFDEVIEKQLKVMDLTAFTLCREHQMPIIVFDINKTGNLSKVIEDHSIGTIIH